MWSWASSDEHLLKQPFFEGLGVDDLLGHAFDLAVEGGEEVGDLGLFFHGGETQCQPLQLSRIQMDDRARTYRY